MPRPTPAAAGAALVALLIASCATAPDELSESEPAPTSAAATAEETQASQDDGLAEGAVRSDRTPPSAAPENGTRTVSPNARGPYDNSEGERATPIMCSDGEALRANEGHEPAGWPTSVAEGEDLPDPECHPDFIELPTWEHYHSTCMHPQAHGTLGTDEDLERSGQDPMSEQERWEREWEASEIRSWWTPPVEGEPCLGHDGGADQESANGPSRAESFVPLPETAFTVDHTADGRHGLEVAVSFNVHRQAVNNEANVIRAVSHAVEAHPDYDLIIVRGYSDAEMTDGDTQLIDAWYKPENVENMDLENPEAEGAYDHCYSCAVNGHPRG